MMALGNVMLILGVFIRDSHVCHLLSWRFGAGFGLAGGAWYRLLLRLFGLGSIRACLKSQHLWIVGHLRA